jgi:hypothetical protein
MMAHNRVSAHCIRQIYLPDGGFGLGYQPGERPTMGALPIVSFDQRHVSFHEYRTFTRDVVNDWLWSAPAGTRETTPPYPTTAAHDGFWQKPTSNDNRLAAPNVKIGRKADWIP